jgi:hypothetical protein
MHVLRVADNQLQPPQEEGRPALVEVLCDECDSTVDIESLDPATRRDLQLRSALAEPLTAIVHRRAEPPLRAVVRSVPDRVLAGHPRGWTNAALDDLGIAGPSGASRVFLFFAVYRLAVSRALVGIALGRRPFARLCARARRESFLAPFGTALGIYSCWVILDDDARRAFARTGRGAAAPMSWGGA